jgi:hypothetical protein
VDPGDQHHKDPCGCGSATLVKGGDLGKRSEIFQPYKGVGESDGVNTIMLISAQESFTLLFSGHLLDLNLHCMNKNFYQVLLVSI